MTESEVNKAVMSTIEDAIDEVTLFGQPDSFVEMYADVVHVFAGRDWYFRVKLECVTDDDCDIGSVYEPPPDRPKLDFDDRLRSGIRKVE